MNNATVSLYEYSACTTCCKAVSRYDADKKQNVDESFNGNERLRQSPPIHRHVLRVDSSRPVDQFLVDILGKQDFTKLKKCGEVLTRFRFTLFALNHVSGLKTTTNNAFAFITNFRL